MRNKSLLRQVALVSYGTQFLRGETSLDDWYRHGVFFDARFQFRSLSDNTLLADDFTWWLAILKLSGARCLSLHRATEFDISLPCILSGEYALVAHFADHHQIWATGREEAGWREHPLIPAEARQTMPAFPNAAGYSAELDSYWCIEDRQGSLDVPATSWKELTSAIAADLGITFPSSLAQTGPFVVPTSAEWAKLPLFPYSGSTAAAHRMLATLDHEAAAFSNDMNPKNENNLDKSRDGGPERWGKRLDSWMVEVLLASANHFSASTRKKSTRWQRTDASPPPGQAGGAAERYQSAYSPSADEHVPPSTLPSNARWTNRMVELVAIAVLSLFVLAVANIIVAFPWLAILIGLPCALAAKYRKSD